jgi:hypothetical protein
VGKDERRDIAGGETATKAIGSAISAARYSGNGVACIAKNTGGCTVGGGDPKTIGITSLCEENRHRRRYTIE